VSSRIDFIFLYEQGQTALISVKAYIPGIIKRIYFFVFSTPLVSPSPGVSSRVNFKSGPSSEYRGKDCV
jgi:hypothetical protein